MSNWKSSESNFWIICCQIVYSCFITVYFCVVGILNLSLPEIGFLKCCKNKTCGFSFVKDITEKTIQSSFFSIGNIGKGDITFVWYSVWWYLRWSVFHCVTITVVTENNCIHDNIIVFGAMDLAMWRWWQEIFSHIATHFWLRCFDCYLAKSRKSSWDKMFLCF